MQEDPEARSCIIHVSSPVTRFGYARSRIRRCTSVVVTFVVTFERSEDFCRPRFEDALSHKFIVRFEQQPLKVFCSFFISRESIWSLLLLQ